MNELERLTLQRVRQLTEQIGHLVSSAAVKSHKENERINAEKDIYPIGSLSRDIDQLVKAILENK